MRKRKKRILTVLLAIPSALTAIVILVCLTYSYNNFIIENVGSVTTNSGLYPYKVVLPNGFEKQYIHTWQRPKVCADLGYQCYEETKISTYDKVKERLKKYYSGKQLNRYLNKISIYETLGKGEKIFTSIPWDYIVLLGVILMYNAVKNKRGYTTLFLWWWYSLCGYISSAFIFGIHRLDIIKNEMARSNIYVKAIAFRYNSPVLEYIHLIVFFLVPLFFLFLFLNKKIHIFLSEEPEDSSKEEKKQENHKQQRIKNIEERSWKTCYLN